MADTATMSDPGPSTSTAGAGDKRAERMQKLRELKKKREQANKANHVEVVQENIRSQLPANWHKKQEWAKRKLDDLEEKDRCTNEEKDYEIEKARNYQADEAARWDRRKAAKKNPDTGFTSFEDAAGRKYDRLVRQIKPDMQDYEKMKQELPEQILYPDKDTHIFNVRKDTEEDIDRLVNGMDNDYKRQARFSRRRTFDHDADIDYINDRNMAFNKKIERFYGKYTTEIKQNLERGTAV